MVIYLDSGDCAEMRKWFNHVEGFTTNPSLMKAAGIRKYQDFAKEALDAAKGKPISFEVLADDVDTMTEQARLLSILGPNVFVKIPIVSSSGISNTMLIKNLWRYSGIKINITAVLSRNQINALSGYLSHKTPTILSIFCGRIADTGVNPEITFNYARITHSWLKNVQYLWASAREVYNVYQAEACKADIITLSPSLLAKYLDYQGRNLDEFSAQTVEQFYNDSKGIEF